MKKPDNKRLLFNLLRVPAQSGLIGLIGLGLVVFALLAYFQKQRPAERELRAQEAELSQKERALELRAKEPVPAPDPNTVVRADETYTTFLREGVRLAALNNLQGTQIEYRTLSEAGGRLVRYGLQFPVNGTYPDLRNFVIQISKIPGVRVEVMDFMRAQIGDPMVVAQIQLSYLTEVKAAEAKRP